ncbi:hypothetical protein ACFLXQ_01490 [Chloroflexota bacterium]
MSEETQTPLSDEITDEGVKIVIDGDSRLVVTASHQRFAKAGVDGEYLQAWQRIELNVSIQGTGDKPVEFTLENMSDNFPADTIATLADHVSAAVEAALDDWQTEVEAGITPLPEYQPEESLADVALE